MRIIVNLDPLRRGFKLEQLAEFAKKTPLRAGVRKIARQRLLGIVHRHRGQLAPRAALRPADPHPMPGADGQRLAKKILLLGFVGQQNFGRRVLVVIELAEKGRQNGGGRGVGIVGQEVGPVAVIRPATDEEGLNAGPLAASRQCDDVGVFQIGDIDVLAGLNARQGTDAVSPDRRRLELQRVGGGVHACGVVALNLGRGSGQEAPRLIKLRGVVGLADKPDTGAAASLDLILQAWARAGVEDGIGTGAQHESPCQVRHRAVDRASRGEGPEIITLAGLAAAMFRQLAERMVGCQQDLRQALVVAKKDVVARLQLLDQVRLKKQRLDLGLGNDHLKRLGLADHAHQPVRQAVRLRIAGHPASKVARLADIERLADTIQHPVDPRIAGQFPDLGFEEGQTARQVRRQVAGAGGLILLLHVIHNVSI